jgi:SulP family sulfate permease
MDRLKRTHFLDGLNGRVFLSQNRAFSELLKDDGQDHPVDDPYLARGMI